MQRAMQWAYLSKRKADLETARAELAAARASTPPPTTCAARNALDAPAF